MVIEGNNNKSIGDESGEPSTRYVLPRDAVYRKIALSRNDYLTLSIYSYKNKVPRTTMLHEMLVAYIKCVEHDHLGNLAWLQERNKKLEAEKMLLLMLFHKYYRRFGRIW